MSIYLDSASADDARAAAAFGFVTGATTNPTLVTAARRPAEDAIRHLCALLPGMVFYQLTALTLEEREAEARRFATLVPGRVGLKIPTTLENLGLAARLVRDGLVVGMTAIFSAGQAVLAAEARTHYVVPYVNRSTRLLGDGLALVRAMRAVLDATGGGTEILAASIKTPDEGVATLLAGAHHLTLPLAVIEAMAEHPLSRATIKEFAAESSASIPSSRSSGPST